MIAAVVVLFHPKIEQLRLLFTTVYSQVDAVWFIDNTPGSNGAEFAPVGGESAWEVNYRPLGENLGIARAQNMGILEAQFQDHSHILLLDQDSLIPPGTVEKLLAAERRLLLEGVRVAAVGPVFVDEKTGLPGKAHRHKWFRLEKPFIKLSAKMPVETDWIIASGSLIRAKIIDHVGLMRDELFIDAVDMEWGLRARSFGLRSFIVPSAQIKHSVGDSSVLLMGVHVIIHSDVRNYYIARNWSYLLRVKSMGMRWRSGAPFHLVRFLAVHVWLAKDHGQRVRLFGRALRDGLTKRMGKYQL